jgi:hypothetical protein
LCTCATTHTWAHTHTHTQSRTHTQTHTYTVMRSLSLSLTHTHTHTHTHTRARTHTRTCTGAHRQHTVSTPAALSFCPAHARMPVLLILRSSSDTVTGDWVHRWAVTCLRGWMWRPSGILQSPLVPDFLRVVLAVVGASNCWTLAINILGYPMRMLWWNTVLHLATLSYSMSLVLCSYNPMLDTSPTLQIGAWVWNSSYLMFAYPMEMGPRQIFNMLALVLLLSIHYLASCSLIFAENTRRQHFREAIRVAGRPAPLYGDHHPFSYHVTLFAIIVGFFHFLVFQHTLIATNYQRCSQGIWECPSGLMPPDPALQCHN